MINIVKKNSVELAESIDSSHVVLDVGGAIAPFMRADWIIDILPFEEVSWIQQRGVGAPRVKKETYVQHDICSRGPWPFADKQFDFVFCSHVLEDIRDPIWVCSEMIRVSKAGYIEIPSRLYETTFGLETKGLAGATHHRWVIDVHENKLRFTFKFFHIHYPFINKNKQHLPQQHPDMLLKLQWQDTFDFYEHWLLSGKEVFEYFLERAISEKEKWNIYRKVSSHNYFVAWLRYFKNTSPLFASLLQKMKK